jgi:hypothetical protein
MLDQKCGRYGHLERDRYLPVKMDRERGIRLAGHVKFLNF